MILTVNAEFTKHNWHFALLGAFSNVSRPCESANMEMSCKGGFELETFVLQYSSEDNLKTDFFDTPSYRE